MNCTMKKYKLIAVFLLLGCLCSCTKFLDLPAKNERAVQSLDDIKSVLAGYLSNFDRRFVSFVYLRNGKDVRSLFR